MGWISDSFPQKTGYYRSYRAKQTKSTNTIMNLVHGHVHVSVTNSHKLCVTKYIFHNAMVPTAIAVGTIAL